MNIQNSWLREESKVKKEKKNPGKVECELIIWNFQLQGLVYSPRDHRLNPKEIFESTSSSLSQRILQDLVSTGCLSMIPWKNEFHR